MFFISLIDSAEDADFERDSRHLEQALDIKRYKFRIWKVSIQALRNYFGEKIALYFFFIQEYTSHLFRMAIIETLVYILIKSSSNNDFIFVMNLINTYIIVIWQTYFTLNWKLDQKMFNLTYGQTQFKQQKVVRPQFKGQVIRNVANDDMNDQ